MGTTWMRAVAIASLVVGAALPSTTATAKVGGTTRPFAGMADGLVTLFAPPNLEAVATGQATHLGRFTREETLVLGEGGSLSGTIEFTAADGDELFVAVTGGFTSADTAEGTYTITGGTGRFDGASGTATFRGTLEGLAIHVEFSGTIDY